MKIAKRSQSRPTSPPTPFGATLTPVESLRGRLLAGISPVAAEEVAPHDAVGAALAVDLAFSHDQPPTAIALRRGFAVRAADTIGASPYAPVELAAPPEVEPGGPVEPPFDAVLAIDAATPGRDGVLVQTALAPGADLLPRGWCGSAGAPIAAAGSRLTAAAALVAEAAGLAAVSVRRPRVLVLHGDTPAERASARGLAALLAAGPATVSIAPFDAAASIEVDLPLFLGRGDLDAADPALALLRERGRVDGGGAALVGCEAIVWGEIAGGPALVLPGRPEELLVATLVLIEPIVARLAGETRPEDLVGGRLARKLVSQIGFTELALLTRTAAGDFEPLATGRPPWTAIGRAEAWIELGPECEGHDEATTITARAMPFARARPHGATA